MEDSFAMLRLFNSSKEDLLFPTEKKQETIGPSESCRSYLKKCETNLLAEIWALYNSNINPSSKNWRDERMTRLYVKNMAFYSDAKHKLSLIHI